MPFSTQRDVVSPSRRLACFRWGISSIWPSRPTVPVDEPSKAATTRCAHSISLSDGLNALLMMTT